MSSRLKLAVPFTLAAFLLTFVDFTLIWRYFAWSQLISAVAVLFASTAYLIQKKKPYIITLLPAIICTLITFGYIIQAPEGFRLPSTLANIITIIATAVVVAVFIYKHKFSNK